MCVCVCVLNRDLETLNLVPLCGNTNRGKRAFGNRIYVIIFVGFWKRLGQEYTKLKKNKYKCCIIKMLEGKIRNSVSYFSEDGLPNLGNASASCILALRIWRWKSVSKIQSWSGTNFYWYFKGCVSKTIHFHNLFNTILMYLNPTIDSPGSFF